MWSGMYYSPFFAPMVLSIEFVFEDLFETIALPKRSHIAQNSQTDFYKFN